MMSCKTLALTILLIFMTPVTPDTCVVANNQADDTEPILGTVWRWEWTNNLNYTRQDCPGGYGTMTVTKGDANDLKANSRSISFKGKARTGEGTETEEFSKSGSWEYVGQDSSNYNRRKYRFKWDNDTDTLIMGDAGNYLRGTNGNGKCLVTGRKQSAK
jgi:hypothetical protein